jgi:hypothetical protein
MSPRHLTHTAWPETLQLWASIDSITTATAEVLCYNETTTPDKTCPAASRQIAPLSFYTENNQVKFVCFEGGNRPRIDTFRSLGLFHALQDDLSPWTSHTTIFAIRRIGDDPRAWVDQTILSYASVCRNLLSTVPDPNRLEADVLAHAQHLMREAIRARHVVHLEAESFPSMLNRVHRLYGVDSIYETVCAPCTEAKPCLCVKCANCNLKERAANVRRNAAKAFLDPDYCVPYTPEYVKDIWRRSVAREL